LMLDPLARAGGHRRSQFVELFADLAEHRLRVGPIEADGPRLFRQPLRADQGRQRYRNAADRRSRRLTLPGALLRLDLLPVADHFAGSGDGDVAEHVRVATDELVGDHLTYLGEVELPFLARDPGLDPHLAKQIAPPR